MTDRLDIVVFATRNWREYQRRPHYTALSKYARVLVVEPPITPYSIIRDPKEVLQFLLGKSRLRQESPSLFVFTPLASMPYGLAWRNDFLSLINGRSLALDVERVLKELDFQDWLQICFMPLQEGLFKSFRPALRCFEIIDQVSTFFGPDTDLSRWQDVRALELEKRICTRADIIFATSEALYESKKEYNPHTYLVPNAADVEHFSRAQDGTQPVPEDLRELPSPRIGFVGHLTDFFHAELLRHIAAHRPDWSFVLVGEDNTTPAFRTEVRLDEVLARPNVHWIGRRDYEDLPDYIRGFDVCTMLYPLRDRLRFSQPNKIHQYLASGKPVVSTDFPSVRKFDDVIEVAKDFPDFLARLDKVLLHDTNEARGRRISVAQENSLEVRARQKMAIFRTHLAHRKAAHD
ncbi:glycosyltransferase [Elusimicrobiota bacterium]